MKCSNCGCEIEPGGVFCANCGAVVETVVEQNKQAEAPVINDKDVIQERVADGSQNTNQRNNTPVIIVTIIASLAIIMAAVAALLIADPFGWLHNRGSEQNGDASFPTAMPLATATPMPTATPEPTLPPSMTRLETYSRNYTYKRMNDIHSSVSASDSELLEMQELITNFNTSWTDYINVNDRTVFNYLREGTEAYNNAVKYGRKNITESYEVMDVRDARKTNSDYYVWVYEVINEYSDKTERKEYHWVYRIGHDNGGYYVADYTSDPAYN